MKDEKRRKRIIGAGISALLLALLTVVALAFGSQLSDGEKKERSWDQEDLRVQKLAETLYHGCYVLYAKSGRVNLRDINYATAWETGNTGEKNAGTDEGMFFAVSAEPEAEELLRIWEREFWDSADQFSYYAQTVRGLVQTDSPGVGRIVTEVEAMEMKQEHHIQSQAEEKGMREFYRIRFDGEGKMNVQSFLQEEFSGDSEGKNDVITLFERLHGEQSLEQCLEKKGVTKQELERAGFTPIKNYTVYLAIPVGK